jgi:cytochrome c556
MKTGTKIAVAALLTASSLTVFAEQATSEKHAKKSTEWRQATFQLIASNMGALGAMAKGKMPMNADLAEKNATRINQLANMLSDYMAVDTRKFSVETEALDKVWVDKEDFAKKIDALINTSSNLQSAAQGGNEGAIKQAIGGVGKSCKGCHDSYKKD